MPRLAVGALDLAGGGRLEDVEVAYETWGAPAPEAVLVCHALTGDQHPADRPGRSGWWSGVVGPGRPVDTRRHYVVASNVLGGCYGTTGPDAAGRAADGRPFPDVAVQDMVAAQARLLEALGVRRLRLVTGGSLGGLQALSWARGPLPARQVLAIGAADRLPSLQVALCHAQHVALELGLRHGDGPGGLRAARAIGMTTYRSEPHLAERFGRRSASGGPRRFALESYLDHHGNRLAERFEPWSYLVLSRAMASFHWDLAVAPGTRVDLVAIEHDWLFPEPAVRALDRALRRRRVAGRTLRLRTTMGHDAFLAEQDALGALVRALLDEEAAPAQREASAGAAGG